MRVTSRRFVMAAWILMASASLAPAHYHFIHFNSRSAPWRGIPEKFDLKTLPEKTLPYFISDQTGIELADKDTYVGLISQIRAAAKAWNDVETSELRLAFSGFAAPDAAQSSPSLEVVFEEMPPGIIAAGTPRVKIDSNGDFVPILKSIVMISPNLKTNPSFSEKMYGTLVHEFGHALGLQHTFTSSVMSTRVTRSTSRAKTLTSDDIAGISLLYPTPRFSQNTGSISGRVTMSGNGVNLASVVAISTSGPAISTLTNPDGTYTISGLPLQQYFVYAHPLPPAQQGQPTAGDIIFPKDSEGRTLVPSGPFRTIFYPGTNDPSRAFTVSPTAGSAVENVDFEVRSRSGYAINSVDTYSYPGSTAAKPAYLSPNTPYPFLVAAGSGLFSGDDLASGLTVSVLGGASLSVRPYSPAPTSYVQIDFDVRMLSIAADGPRHLVFSQNNDIYVLPAAFFHVRNLPPSIDSVISVSDGDQRLAVISGTNLSDGSQVYFDGVRAAVREFDSVSGRITVVPPGAPSNHRASVVILNPDGQSSLLLQGDSPSTYTYVSESSMASASANLTLTPSTVASGTEVMLQIDAVNPVFRDSNPSIGFGSSDIVVRQVALVSPTRMLVNVSVRQNAQSGFAHISIASGLELVSQQFALQVLPSNQTFWLRSAVLNADKRVPGVSADGMAVLTIGNAPVTLTKDNVTLRLNDKTIPILGVSEDEITFQVPSGTVAGPVVLRVEADGERSQPILMIVDPPPPRILSAVAEEGSKTLRTGQLVALTVSNLETPGTQVDPATVTVRLDDASLQVAQVLEQESAHKVVVYIPSNSPTGREVPLKVSVGSRVSAAFSVTLSK